MEISIVKRNSKKGTPYVALVINGIYVSFDTLTICKVCDISPSVLSDMVVGDIVPVLRKE